MTAFTYFLLDTGAFACFSDRPSSSAAFVSVEGRYPGHRWRLGSDGQPEEYQPPAPPTSEWQTWAWDAESWRWVGIPTQAAVQRDGRAEILRQVEELEAAQHRPLRELMLDPGSAEARARVAALDQRIAELRAGLAAPATAGT